MEKENKQADSAALNIAFFAILLFLLSSIVRLGSSLYTPALTIIGKELNVSEALMSFSLTAYFAGFAVATLFVGPASDAFGRRKVIFGGILVFIAGTILCGTAGGAASLITGRLLQAVGASAIPVTSRAMIRDACNDRQVITVLGWMGTLGGFVPIVAPALGGLITQTIGWRYNFWILFAVCLLIGCISLAKLPETLSPDGRHKFHAKDILSRYKNMLVAPEFFIVIAPLVFCFSIQGAYITASPFIFMTDFHLTPLQFGLTNFFLVAALLMGRTICTSMIKKYSIYTVYMTGAAITLIGGIAFLAVYLLNLPEVSASVLCFIFADMAWFKGLSLEYQVMMPFFLDTFSHLLLLILCSIFFGMGFGASLPIGLKSVMTAFKNQSGTVSAIYGSLTLGSAALSSALIGFMMKHGVSEFASLSWFAFGASLAALVFASFSKKRLV